MLAKKKIKIVDRPQPTKGLKTSHQMERHLKGLAHYRRIEILFLVFENKGITLEGLCGALKGNPKTISHHTHKLVQAGLINKTRFNKSVGHTLSPYGKYILKFLKSFQQL